MLRMTFNLLKIDKFIMLHKCMDCNTLIIESNDAIRNAFLLAIFQKKYVNYYIKVNTCFNMPTKI